MAIVSACLKLLINMNWFLKYKIKILLFVFIAVFLIIGIILLSKYPFGVKQYKTVKIGMQAIESANTHTVWAPPYNKVLTSGFYVYVLGDESLCLNSGCGIGGYFVQCLGGWLSGYSYEAGDVGDYGFREAGIDIGKQTVITIADKEGKIVGIYPGARIRNLSYIMRNHKDLVPGDGFKVCSDLLPSRWK